MYAPHTGITAVTALLKGHSLVAARLRALERHCDKQLVQRGQNML
jgi:hypothetical protein